MPAALGSASSPWGKIRVHATAIPDAPAFDLPDGDFPFQADTPPDVLVRDLLKLEEGTLHRLASTLDPAAFDQAAAMLGGAGSIELCAAGSGL